MFETLSFEGVVSKIHEVFDRVPDRRRFSPNLRYSIKDAALGAFAMFFSQALCFLAHQQAMEFSSTFEQLEKAGQLKGYRFFEGCLLVLSTGPNIFGRPRSTVRIRPHHTWHIELFSQTAYPHSGDSRE